jgi:hypothetical protein
VSAQRDAHERTWGGRCRHLLIFLLPVARCSGWTGAGAVERNRGKVEVRGLGRVGVGRHGEAGGLEHEVSLGEECVVGDDAGLTAEALFFQQLGPVLNFCGPGAKLENGPHFTI